MTNNVKILLIFFFCFQLLIGASFELAHDEAYYWIFSKHLDWGYFDHPPVVAIVIKIFSIFSHSELAVRFGFILIHLFTVLLILDLVPKNRKLESVILFFSFPLASMAGLFALPDMPLLFFTVVYFWMLKKYLVQDNLKNSILLGLTIALLLNSKYHGILLIFFTIVAIPSLFRKKSFYITFMIAFFMFLPHVLWQFQHDFATLRYHFFERPKSDFNLFRSIEYLGTQIVFAGLFVGPVVWWITLKTKTINYFERVLKFNAIGIILFFLLSSFSKKIEANWTIPATIPLIILSINHAIWTKRSVRLLLMTSCIILLFARLALVIEIPIRRSMEFHGWKNWSNNLLKKCSNPWLANNYQMASKLSFYIQKPIHSLNLSSRKNQFDFWGMDKVYYKSEKVCYLTNSSQFGGEMVQTPENKLIYLVKDKNLSELLELKSQALLEKP